MACAAAATGSQLNELGIGGGVCEEPSQQIDQDLTKTDHSAGTTGLLPVRSELISGSLPLGLGPISN